MIEHGHLGGKQSRVHSVSMRPMRKALNLAITWVVSRWRPACPAFVKVDARRLLRCDCIKRFSDYNLLWLRDALIYSAIVGACSLSRMNDVKDGWSPPRIWTDPTLWPIALESSAICLNNIGSDFQISGSANLHSRMVRNKLICHASLSRAHHVEVERSVSQCHYAENNSKWPDVILHSIVHFQYKQLVSEHFRA